MNKNIVKFISILILSGCTNVSIHKNNNEKSQNNENKQQMSRTKSNQSQESTNAFTVCKKAEENTVLANSTYREKTISINAEVRSIEEGFQPRYYIYMRSGDIYIHAGTEDKAEANSVSVGKKFKVHGTITELDFDYDGCSISIKNSKFKK